MAAREKQYYVYRLVDPRNGLPFYIGKGKRNRIDAHEKEARKGVVHPKCEVIREIEAAGLRVKKEEIKRFFSEDAAYRFERRTIKSIGLDSLTNLAPGGRFAFSCKPKDPEKQKDKTWIDAFCFLIKKCGTKNPRFLLGGQWHYLPDDFIPKMRSKAHQIAKVRGVDWVANECKKHKVIIDFGSKVENHATV